MKMACKIPIKLLNVHHDRSIITQNLSALLDGIPDFVLKYDVLITGTHQTDITFWLHHTQIHEHKIQYWEFVSTKTSYTLIIFNDIDNTGGTK